MARRLRRGGQAQLGEPGESLPVAVGDWRPAVVVAPAQLIDRHVQRALGGDSRILLAHRAGRRVTRIGEQPQRALALGRQRLVLLGDPRVHLLEALLGHEDLAAHLETARWIALELVRHGRDAANVGRDVLAAPTVAARRRLHQPPLFVDQRDRQPVDLRLGDIGERLEVQQLRGAPPPLAQLVGVEGVAQAEQRELVLDHRKGGLLDLRADLLRRAVGGDQLRVALFEFAQLAEQRVVIGVADLRVVVDEIAAVVVSDLLAQLFNAVPRLKLRAVRAPAVRVASHRKSSIRAPRLPSPAPFPSFLRRQEPPTANSLKPCYR